MVETISFGSKTMSQVSAVWSLNLAGISILTSRASDNVPPTPSACNAPASLAGMRMAYTNLRPKARNT
jgi:hypothetical protein